MVSTLAVVTGAPAYELDDCGSTNAVTTTTPEMPAMAQRNRRTSAVSRMSTTGASNARNVNVNSLPTLLVP